MRPLADVDHPLLRYLATEGRRRAIGGHQLTELARREVREEEHGMEMRPALLLAVFTRDEIPNFVTRTSKQLDKQLEVARLEQLVREIIAGRIGQRDRRADRRIGGFGHSPSHIIADAVFPAAPALAAGDRLHSPLLTAFNPDLRGVYAHFRLLRAVSLKGYVYQEGHLAARPLSDEIGRDGTDRPAKPGAPLTTAEPDGGGRSRPSGRSARRRTAKPC